VLVLGTFNAKDFFPQAATPDSGDFAAKVRWTAKMIDRIGADVLALQEIGPPETLDALAAELEHGYGARVIGTPDARGIRCAILSRLPILEARVHTADSIPFPAFALGDPPPFAGRIPLRRGIVVARVEAPDLGPVTVVVAHFKSKRAVPMRDANGEAIVPATPRERAEGDARSMAWRAAEALCVRGLVDEALALREDALVAVMGDLNDVIGSATLDIVTGDDRYPGALASCAEMIARERRHTAIFGGAPSQIDHIFVSAPLRARLLSAEAFNDALREHPHVPSAEDKAADPTVAEPPPTIDSDHAPLVARFG
jgi:endonuclease/exonuclease/phosphatase family metal-dependent hydrolase